MRSADEQGPAGELPPSAEEKVKVLVEEFVERLQTGEEPDLHDLILSHPEIAPELERRLQAALALYCLAHADRDAGDMPTGAGRRPRFIGRFRLLERLGGGASSVVYRAYDPHSRSYVALKVLRAGHAADPDFIERFTRDARIAARLRHPHIVPVRDVGQHGELRYLVLELVRGQSLDQRLRGEPLGLREAAELVEKVALALDHAHRAGIVHRDVKPSNILLDEQDEPRLSDFGLARGLDGEPSLTVAGQIVGTPGYMSPEQAQGNAYQADGRSDVYNLGVVLYRLLTGRLPFQANSLATLLAQIADSNREPPGPRALNPEVPRELETICLKAMAKQPGDRFVTARAFADELRRWLDAQPLTVRPPPFLVRMGRLSRRHPLASVALAAAGLVLLVVGVPLGWTAWEQRTLARLEKQARAKAEADLAQQETEVAQQKIENLLEKARHRLRLRTLGRRAETQAILRGISEPRRRLPEGPARDRFDLEARTLFACSLSVPDLRSGETDRARLLPSAFHTWRVALEPDGKAMAVGTQLGPVRWERGRPFTLPQGLDPRLPRPRLWYNPDGSYLLFAPEEGGLQLWDGQRLWDGGKNGPLFVREPSAAGTVLSAGFARDGKGLWVCSSDGQVQRLSLPDLKPGPGWSVKDQPGSWTAAAFNDEATRLAVGSDGGRVLLYCLDGRVLHQLSPSPMMVEALAWSPDSQLLAVGTRDGQVRLWESTTAAAAHSFTTSGAGVSNIVFHPNGRWVLAGRLNDGGKMWNVRTGEPVLTLPSIPWAISRDGSCIAWSSHAEAGFGDLVFPQVMRTFDGHGASIGRLAWSADTPHLVSLDARFEVRVWDVPRAVSVDDFRPPPGGFFTDNAAVALSDDGRLVAYASGGRERSVVLIRDAAARKDLAEWKLPGGFEQLVYAGRRRPERPDAEGPGRVGVFLLVREEEVKDSKTRLTRSMVYELEPGEALPEPRLLRSEEPGDIAGFLTSGLTPNGSYYWWVGPRRPHDRHRVEVWELATPPRRVARVEVPSRTPASEAGAYLSPDSSHLWVNHGDGPRYLHRLPGPDPPQAVSRNAITSTQLPGWVVYGHPGDNFHATDTPALYRWGEEQPRLRLLGSDLTSAAGGPIAFSQDGRYLAWGGEDGVITVADLEALDKDVAQFEEALSRP